MSLASFLFSMGLTSEHAIASAGSYDCPVRDPGIQEEDFPGFDRKNELSFSRDQDAVGSCYAFAWTDFFAYHAKKQNKWPKSDVYSAGASAMDILQQISVARHVDHPNLESFLESETGGLFAQHDIVDHISKVGLCAEKKFPSEFFPRTTGALETYTKFSRSFAKMKTTEASVSDLYWCPECISMAPELFGATSSEATKKLKKSAEEIKNEAQKISGKKNSYQAFVALNEAACKPSERVKFNKLDTVLTDDMAVIKEQLRKDNPLVVSIGSYGVLSPKKVEEARASSKDGKVGNHSAVLVGAVQIPEAANQCYYVIKNSWGSNCEPNPPAQLCLTTGAMAIRADVFERNIKSAVYAK